MINKLYFCESCRKNVQDVTTLQFVEENSDRGFCSEKCILEFYRPYMMSFESQEDSFREKLNYQMEDQYLDITANQHYLSTALATPHEVWSFETELGQKFYTHILNIEDTGTKLYFIIICSYVDNSPSFVFYRMVSAYDDLAELYRQGDHVEVSDLQTESFNDGMEDIEVSNEIIEGLELKKSAILAKLLMSRKDNDIAIENFVAYDKYMDETLETADDVYEHTDEDGDLINTFIKSYCVDGLSFFFVVVTQQYTVKGDISILPIIGFPSNDNDMFTHFATGRKINETLKN